MNKHMLQMVREDRDRLWARYHKEPNETLRWQLANSYLYWAKEIAANCAGTKKNGNLIGCTPLSEEDLVNIGLMYIWERIPQYDHTNKARFHTYIYLGLRGRMVDSLRKASYYRREDRNRTSYYPHTKKQEPPLRVVISYDWQASAAKLHMDQPIAPLHKLFSYFETYDDFVRDDMLGYLGKFFDSMELLVIRLYYFERLRVREVGNAIGYSECWVHLRLKDIKSYMAANPWIMENICEVV